MYRREVLALGSGLLGAGCLGSSSDQSEPDTVFSDAPCRGFLPRSTCYHGWVRDDTEYDVVLIPDREEVPGGDLTATFELTPTGSDSVWWYDTTMMRRYEGNWQVLPAKSVPDDDPVFREVPPDERAQFTLAEARYGTGEYGSDRPLGAGLFAFVVTVRLDRTDGEAVSAVAMFRIAGDALTLDVPDHVSTVRDGRTVTVRSTDQRASARTHRTVYESTATPGSDPVPVSPELAAQRWDLSVPVSLLGADDVDTVVTESRVPDRVRGPSSLLGYAAWDPGDGWSDPTAGDTVFSYDGTAFTVSQRPIEQDPGPGSEDGSSSFRTPADAGRRRRRE